MILERSGGARTAWVMKRLCPVIVVIMLALVPPATHSCLAQDLTSALPVPGRWDLVDVQPKGAPLVVVMKNGSRRNCKFTDSDPASLRLACTVAAVSVSKVDVERVERPHRASRTGLAAVIGAAAGMAAGAGTKTFEGPLADRGRNLIVFGAVGALIGGFVGHAASPSASGPEVLYRAS